MKKNKDFKLVLGFVFCFCLGMSQCGWAQSADLSPKSTSFLNRYFQTRSGVLIWQDLKSSQRIVFGNPAFLNQHFSMGSLMKLITAEAALKSHLSKFEYTCSGKEKLNGKFDYCWRSNGHGHLSLSQALAYSCNLYFKNLAGTLGVQAIQKELRSYQPFQKAWELPADLLEKNLRELAIGDSALFQASPNEIFQFWLAFLGRIQGPSNSFFTQALFQATQQGTAKELRFLPISILGKTGTAPSVSLHHKTEGWFLGAFPAEKPQVAFLVFITNAHGYREPVELVRRVLRESD